MLLNLCRASRLKWIAWKKQTRLLFHSLSFEESVTISLISVDTWNRVSLLRERLVFAAQEERRLKKGLNNIRDSRRRVIVDWFHVCFDSSLRLIKTALPSFLQTISDRAKKQQKIPLKMDWWSLIVFSWKERENPLGFHCSCCRIRTKRSQLLKTLNDFLDWQFKLKSSEDAWRSSVDIWVMMINFSLDY